MTRLKKIDLHIHTKAAANERQFDFDLSALQAYVCASELDCIAVTNHNDFDLEQFHIIRAGLDILVLPGIEVDIEGSQMLVVAEPSNLRDFDLKCEKVREKAPSRKKPLSVDVLKEIFGDLSDYLLIPHYDKNPDIKQETLDALNGFVTAGEVTSPKKFMYCIKDDEKLVPLYFSDSRIEMSLAEFSLRQTYIACDQISFSAIRSCIRDKSKVALSPKDGNELFQIFSNGQQLSTGLNVLLGERSSGKSHTLEMIDSSVHNVKYIKQFSLVARNESQDEKRFNKFLSGKNSLFSREYLSELRSIVSEVIDVDLEDDERQIDSYLNSLKKHAQESEKHDAYSRASLFSEEKYADIKQQGLEELIGSTQNLIENEEFRSVVQTHVSIHNLCNLIVELMTIYGVEEEKRLKRGWVNDLVSEVKRKLKRQTAATPIEDIDLYSIAMNRVSVDKFDQVVRAAREPRELSRKPLLGFALVATASEFEGAMELKDLSRLTSAFSDAYSVYGEPYLFLQRLKDIDSLQEADFYKFFVKVEFKILNEDGYEVSGGERSEFYLLHEIEDAQKYDMLLIDEPESSFDNQFLKDSVNQIIKEISKSTPVVLVTHNNTVGASIKPDYLLYTKKDIEAGQIVYRIYSGFPSSKELSSVDGKSVSTYEVAMGALEAGAEAYRDRQESYEDIRN